MENTVVIGVLAFVFSLLLLVFSAFLLTVKTSKKLSNILLSLYLIVVAIDCTAFFYHFFGEVNLMFDMLRMKLSHFKEPLLFLYILSVIYSNFRLKKKHLILLLPWLINIIVLFPNFFLADYNGKIQFYNNFNENPEVVVFTVLGHCISFVYFVAYIYYILRYRKLLLENHTNENDFKNYKWLKQLLIIMAIGSVITIIKGMVRDGEYTTQTIEIWRMIMLLFGMFFVFWLFFKALISPKLFRGIDVNLNTSKEIMIEDEKTKNKEQIVYLKKYMHTEEPYLNPSLTIRNLAEQVNIPMRDLSVLINQDLKQHFFDFINEYRIEKAKEILKDSTKNKQTVLEILYEVGFNSKSSFNTAFKKHTGTTPTQYRKSIV